MKIFSSASKTVFLIVALSACIGFFMKILPTEQFMLLATGAFSYYFTRDRGETPPTV